MNPSLIKRGLDDEMYANACPTIGSLLAAHYSTPEKHREDLYSADGFFFSMYPDRRIYLRPAFSLEFDVDEDPKRPTLWVQVMQLSPGFHQIIPVWRGKAFWNGPDADSDISVGILCYAFAQRHGMHLSEWYAYISDQRINKTSKTTRKAKATVIH